MGRTGSVWALAVTVAAAVLGCGIDVDDLDAKIDTGEIEDLGQEAIDELGNIEVCGGSTLQELFTQDSLTDECRAALEDLLPEPATNFEGRLFTPGGIRAESDGLHVLLQGADGDGLALSAEALASLRVSVERDGEVEAMPEVEVGVVAGADLPADLLSISVVNDYSASMLDEDLDQVAQIQGDLFQCLPPVYEAEVVYFSDEPEVILPFTDDADALAAAVARDDSYERASTALYDGMGVGLMSLAARERPVRILVLSTDGGENASMEYMKPDVLRQLDEEHVFVVVMGALLADVPFMREVSDGRGVFFYTRYYSRLDELIGPYLDSTKELVDVVLPEDVSDAAAIHLEVEGGFSARVAL